MSHTYEIEVSPRGVFQHGVRYYLIHDAGLEGGDVRIQRATLTTDDLSASWVNNGDPFTLPKEVLVGFVASLARSERVQVMEGMNPATLLRGSPLL